MSVLTRGLRLEKLMLAFLVCIDPCRFTFGLFLITLTHAEADHFVDRKALGSPAMLGTINVCCQSYTASIGLINERFISDKIIMVVISCVVFWAL